MTDKFRIFLRASGVWYIEDKQTREQQSLRTREEAETRRLLQAKNEALRQPAINIQIARAYLTASDPMLVSRTWQDVMEGLVSLKVGTNRQRWERAIHDRSFERIRHLALIETRADHFLKVLEEGKVASNAYLRRIPTHPIHYQNENPWVITAIANPEDVIVYTDSRREREVIIDPKRILKVVRDEPAGRCLIEEKNSQAESQTTKKREKSPRTELIRQLQCTVILKGQTSGEGFAQINGRAFKSGEEKPIMIEGREVKVGCLEIREESVVLKIPGIKEPQELWLVASGRRWKSYQGF